MKKQPPRTCSTALKPAHLLLVAGLAAPFPMQALAADINAATSSANDDLSIRMETLTVDGNRLYELAPSEQTGGYTADGATVGTKTPAALRDIPQSVTILTHDYIEDRQFVTLDDLAKYTPGLRTLTNDSGRSSIYARGYEFSESNIDGLPAPMASIFGTVPSLAAMDRVEVMRGPSGLFNSTSELGGIVNLVRKRPTHEFQGHLKSSYGSWDTHQEMVDLSGPLNDSGSVRGRFVASNAQSNGEVDHNDNKDQTLYGALDIDLSDATTLSLGLLHQKRDITPSNGLPAYSDGALLDISRDTYLGANWNNFDGNMTDLFAELDHQFDGGGYGHIGLRASHRDADFKYAYTRAISNTNDLSMMWLGRDFDQHTYSIDASFSQPFETFGQVSEFVVGADYKHYDTRYTSGRGNFAGTYPLASYSPSQLPEPSSNYTTEDSSNSHEVGLYTKLTFRPIERLALIGGARISQYAGQAYTYNRTNGSRSGDDQHLTGRVTPYAGMVYDLTDDYSLYASYSEVFMPQTDQNASGSLIDPREGKQYELGIKGSHFGGTLNSRLSLFQMYDENRSTRVNPSDPYYVASGRTRVEGAEVELSGQLTPNWDILAGYTYMDTDNLDGDANTVFETMPRHQLSIWNNYKLPAGWSIGGGLYSVSDFSMTRGTTTVSAGGYTTVDARVGYEITPKLKASLNVNNLFDREYYSRVGSTSTFNFYGPGRSFMATLEYDL